MSVENTTVMQPRRRMNGKVEQPLHQVESSDGSLNSLPVIKTVIHIIHHSFSGTLKRSKLQQATTF
jgi:hypothetical protein